LLELHALEQAVPGRVTGQRKRRCLLEPHAVRDSLQVGRGDLAVLRVAAVELAAETLLPLAELVAPEHARRAHAALDPVLDHDAIAHAPAAHAGADPRDLARRRAAGAQRQVGVIDRRRAHAHDHFAGARLGVGAVAVDQLLRTAGFRDVDGFHRKIAWHFGALKIQVSTQSTSSILA